MGVGKVGRGRSEVCAFDIFSMHMLPYIEKENKKGELEYYKSFHAGQQGNRWMAFHYGRFLTQSSATITAVCSLVVDISDIY